MAWLHTRRAAGVPRLIISIAQVNELELAVDARSMSKLLDFLRHSFGGGTDVDRPLELSLQRLESQGWEQVCFPAVISKGYSYGLLATV